MARTRSQQYIDAAAGEELPPVEKEEVLEEYDKESVQETIIVPTSVEIELIGEKDPVYLPVDLTLDQLFRQKVMNNVRFTYMLIQSELKHIRSGPIDPTDMLCIGILYKETVQAAIANLMGTVLNRPASDFENRLDDKNTIAVFTWLINTITKTMGSGTSNSKNGKHK